MSRTKRRKRWGQPGTARDGKAGIVGKAPADEISTMVTRPDRREREREAERIAKGLADSDDTPTKPVRRRLWRFWRWW